MDVVDMTNKATDSRASEVMPAVWMSGARKVLMRGLTAVLAVVALSLSLLAVNSSASAAPSDQGYFRFEINQFHQVAAVGRIPQSALQTVSDANNGSKAAVSWTCSSFIGSKVPSNWFVQGLGNLAVQPACQKIVDQVWSSNGPIDSGICFKIPLPEWQRTKAWEC